MSDGLAFHDQVLDCTSPRPTNNIRMHGKINSEWLLFFKISDKRQVGALLNKAKGLLHLEGTEPTGFVPDEAGQVRNIHQSNFRN